MGSRRCAGYWVSLWSAKIQRQSSSTVQEAVLVVKSVQYGVRDHSTCSVETMPLALELHGEIEGQIGKARSQRRVWSAAIVMRQPGPQSFSKMLFGYLDHPIRHSRRIVPINLSQNE